MRKLLTDQRQEWDELASLDPLWAILSFRRRKFGRWDHDSFVATGQEEVERIVQLTSSLTTPRTLSGRSSSPSDLEREPWLDWRRRYPELGALATCVTERRAKPSDSGRTAYVKGLANAWNLLGPPRTEPPIDERGESVSNLAACCRGSADFVGVLRSSARSQKVARASRGDRRSHSVGRGPRQGSDPVDARRAGRRLLLEIGLPLVTDLGEELSRPQTAVLRGLRRLQSPRAIMAHGRDQSRSSCRSLEAGLRRQPGPAGL